MAISNKWFWWDGDGARHDWAAGASLPAGADWQNVKFINQFCRATNQRAKAYLYAGGHFRWTVPYNYEPTAEQLSGMVAAFDCPQYSYVPNMDLRWDTSETDHLKIIFADKVWKDWYVEPVP